MIGSNWASKGAWAPTLSPSVAAALTAAGTTIANALQLPADVNTIGTATAGTGVILPPISGPGDVVFVLNSGASTVKVYAGGGATINGTAGATGISQATTVKALYIATSGSSWVSIVSA